MAEHSLLQKIDEIEEGRRSKPNHSEDPLKEKEKKNGRNKKGQLPDGPSRNTQRGKKVRDSDSKVESKIKRASNN